MKTTRMHLIGLTLLAGCLPSLNPIYTDESLVFDRQLLGVWIQPGAKARWEFSERDEKSYRLLFTDQEGYQGRFIARLVEIEGRRFLDLFPEHVESETSSFYKFHLVPIHTVYWVRKTSPNLELIGFDNKWLDEYLTQHPKEIQFATYDGRKLITAPTPDVQAFVVKHLDAFTAEFSLRRSSEKTN